MQLSHHITLAVRTITGVITYVYAKQIRLKIKNGIGFSHSTFKSPQDAMMDATKLQRLLQYLNYGPKCIRHELQAKRSPQCLMRPLLVFETLFTM
ncbi:hypothetical protein B5X24_HaOG213419 [Helicoverpa armigera]|nr:hypothetical protein B5X24_HaOG213419 [Helicoverpa armigera]